MSEESSAGAPEAEATEPGAHEAGAQEAPPLAPRLRWVSRLRRTSLGVRFVMAIVAALVTAAVVFVAVPSSSPPQYTTLPAPCTMVSRTSLAGLMPHPVGTPRDVPTDGTYKAGSCRWSSAADGQDRTLDSYIVMYRTPSAAQDVRQYYDDSLAAFSCRCRGVAITRRSVTGLGDQATALLVTAGPGADELTAYGTAPAGVRLWVVSRNAVISLGFDIMAVATETTLPPTTAQLTEVTSVARDILAELARPAPVLAAPVSPEPRYAGPHDPCRLVSAATLAKYAPGATVDPGNGSSPFPARAGVQITSCSWNSNSIYVQLNLSVFPDAPRALQAFDGSAELTSGTGTGTGMTVTGSSWLFDVGEQAAAFYETRSSDRGVEIFIWSGDIELDYWIAATASSAPATGTLLAAATAMARDGLAALANPSASSYRQGPVYASPHDACALIKASTLAHYAPGATTDHGLPAPVSVPEEQLSTCGWITTSGSFVLTITVHTSADNALGEYEFDINNTSQTGFTFDSAQPVKRLGDQATAIIQTSLGQPDVDLYVLSGNAVIDLDFGDVSPSPGLSRAELLAAEIAMVRDVLADLPRS